MMRQRLIWRIALAGCMALVLAGPLQAWSATTSLGTARGVRGVEVSLDGGKRWLPLGSRSLPVMEGTQIRSTTGAALVDLAEGSRVNVLPFSAVGVRDSGEAIEIFLRYGRLTFRLHEQTRVTIRTPSAQLDPVRGHPMVGEVFADGTGIVGLQMAQGSFHFREVTGEQRVVLASLEPVFLPKKPVTPLPLFNSGVPPAPPASAKGVFTPRGESIGYLGHDARLVISPGFTADLTQPFSSKLVQLVMAKIPEKDRQEALPLFDVNGGYVGYVAGQAFYDQVQVAQAIEGGAPGLISGTSEFVNPALAAGIPVAFGLFAGGGGGGGVGIVATPFRLRR